MEFQELLRGYMDRLGCSGRELAEASGLSEATISRYRSGERKPESRAERDKLAAGLGRLAEQRSIPGLDGASAAEELGRCFQEDRFHAQQFQANFGTLLSALSISVSELARSTNYDASYLSRIRSGQRRPADPDRFLSAVAAFVVRRCEMPAERRILTELLTLPEEDWEEEAVTDRLTSWLGGKQERKDDTVSGFLQKLDEFDLNAYIRSIHFDQLKVPTAPFQLPLAKTYYGIEQMREGELDFLKATVLSRSSEPVFFCSDMQMDDLAADPEFQKKYMFGMALLLKKGLRLTVVHNLDRPFRELMMGLEGWIPLYMTGQIAPYYLKGVQNNVYCHLLNVSGSAALLGECIAGAHDKGRYELVKGGEALRYCRERAAAIGKKALPLMEIYREEGAAALRAFLTADAGTPGQRRRLLSAPPIAVLEEQTLREMLRARGIGKEREEAILAYRALQRQRLETVLGQGQVLDQIPGMSREEFAAYPAALQLAELFPGEDIRYTYEEYQRHLDEVRVFARAHEGYEARFREGQFRNLSICVHKGRWAMVSKNDSPTIHFVIRYPKLRDAIEAFF